MKQLRTVLSLLMAILLIFSCLSAVACTPSDQETETTTNENTSDALTEVPTAPAETDADTQSETDKTEPRPAPTTTRPAQEVKVLSMNLDANESTASSRVRLMAPLLLSLDADSIGVQECRGSWVNLLKRYLESQGYARVGVDAGGNQDATGMYFATYILYKEDKFNLIDSGTFWLSQTPDIPSIYGPTVDCNRTCTWALLEDKETGFRYVHMNSHLDWMDMSVNMIQVEMIREQVERFEAMGYPVFAGGDFNCDEGTDPYHKMLDSDVVADAKKVAEKANDIATYPSYGEYDVYDPRERPIDYFFVTKEHMTVKEYRVVDEKPEGEYVSDHFPVFVHALVHEMPIPEENALLPAFGEGKTLDVKTTRSGFEITIEQAVSPVGVMASEYRIEVKNQEKTVLNQVKPSGVLKPVTEDTLSLAVSGLNESGTYTVTVVPINIFGDEGQALSTEISFTYDVTDEEMPAADIVDIRVEGDAPVDASPNGYSLQKKGSTSIVETQYGKGLNFNKKSNYKVTGVKNHYKDMTQGFTMEIYFTTGEDIDTFQSLASNMHAGGYGVDWQNGKIKFSVRIGSAYVGASADIVANTTYHLVGVYDGSTVRLYLNGSLMEETTVSGPMVLPTDAGAEYLCIGADSDATGAGEYPIDATVYLVRMYTTPATDNQALYLYHQVGN